MEQQSVNLLDVKYISLAGDGEIKGQDEISTIVKLHSLGWKIRAISRELGISRGTVRKYIRSDGVHLYRQPFRASILDGMEEWLKESFFRHAGNADVIRQELSGRGVVVSLRTVERAVKEHRDELRRKQIATVRFETSPGHQLQADFGEKYVLVGGERVKVHLFTAKLGHSRRMYVKVFMHENQSAWFEAFESAFRHFGGVPREVLVDNASSLVKHHNRSTGELELNEKFKSFSQYWGFLPRACAPRRPQTKGKVESGVKYGKFNCLAGREFSSWEALEEHLVVWLRDVSDVRVLTEREDTPIARFAEEVPMLLPVDKAPYQQFRELQRKVSRDSFVDVDTNRYSVPWKYIGREVRVLCAETELSIHSAGEEIARHAVNRERYLRIVIPEHLDGIIHLGRGENVRRPGMREADSELRIPMTDPLTPSLFLYEAACAF